jgi:hypothetical protein
MLWCWVEESAGHLSRNVWPRKALKSSSLTSVMSAPAARVRALRSSSMRLIPRLSTYPRESAAPMPCEPTAFAMTALQRLNVWWPN